MGEQRSCDGWGGAQRPVGRGNEPKKTGARSARARTRGQNPLVRKIIEAVRLFVEAVRLLVEPVEVIVEG